jgi:nitrate reductase assembly molybdenum cofactor insertion protein NarJ
MDLSGAGNRTKTFGWLVNMKRYLIQFLILCPILVLLSCGKGDRSTSDSSIFSKDETAEAVELVKQANDKLKLIKKRFKDNEPRYEELKTALRDKNEKKVRELSNAFVEQIGAGSEEGTDAIEKLRSAKELNINQEYKEYLQLKLLSLEKYIEAFEQRRQAALILAENYDPKDPVKQNRAITEFKLKEEKFGEIIEIGRSSSEEANDLAKESLRRKN